MKDIFTPITVGMLRDLIDALLRTGKVTEETEVVVRASCEGDYCGPIESVTAETGHDEEETPYLAIDCLPAEELAEMVEDEAPPRLKLLS